MIVDQLTPLLPKDIREVNTQVKRLQAMLDVAIMVNQPTHHQGCRMGPVRDGKLLAHLPVIIHQDVAHRASHRVSPLLD
jgi:hypothetical protein